MNDSPVDYQNRDVTEPGEMEPPDGGGGISQRELCTVPFGILSNENHAIVELVK